MTKDRSNYCAGNRTSCNCTGCLEYHAHRRRKRRAELKGIPVPGPRGERIVKPYLAAKWSDYAKCKGLSTDWFFHNDRNGGPYVTQAKRICHDCPAKDDCLTYALTMGEIYGIWGGMTVGQRKHLGNKLTPIAERLAKAQRLRDRFAATQL